MSGVLERFRKPTGADFIDALWELRKYTLSRAVKFPKRYDRWVTDYIIRATAEAHWYAYKANQIHMDTEENAKKRIELLEKAKQSLKSLFPQLELAYGAFEFDTEKSNEHILVNVWLPKVDNASELLDGIIRHDRKRYQELLKP